MAHAGSCFPTGASQGLPVTLRVGATATLAEATDGQRWELSHQGLVLRRGGHGPGLLFLSGRAEGGPTLACADPDFAAELRLQSGRALEAEFARLDGLGRRRLGRWGLGVAALLVLLLLGAVVVWWVGTSGIRQAVAALPVSVDRHLGDTAFGQMDLGGAPSQDPVLVAAVEAIAARLRPQAERQDFDFRFTVVRAETVNAFALPGGRMVVYTGLIRRCDDAGQLAGVLAHEMAHVTRRHGLHGLARQAGLVIAVQLALGDASGLAGLASQAGMLAVINGYSRTQEREADAEGARMLAAAGFDPLAMAAFFAHLAEDGGPQVPGWLGWMSTHPDHEERIAAIRALASSLPRGADAALEVDWAAVRLAAGATAGALAR